MSLLVEWECLKRASAMTDAEVIAALGARDLRAKIRFIFAAWSGRIDQASRQARPPRPIDLQRMELQAAEEMMAAMRLAK